MTHTPKFQSYLILGNSEATAKESAKIADSLGIKLKTSSPDIQIIEPVKSAYLKKGHILIDAVREIKRTIYQKPLSAKFKLIIFKEAHTLTTDAQNALLKIFEEPPKEAIIILEAENKSKILPTIVSRAVTLQTTSEYKTQESSSVLQDSNLKSQLETIANVQDAKLWLNDQMVILYKTLTKSINREDSVEAKRVQTQLTGCLDAQKMLDANINPKFVLANLIFSLN